MMRTSYSMSLAESSLFIVPFMLCMCPCTVSGGAVLFMLCTQILSEFFVWYSYICTYTQAQCAVHNHNSKWGNLFPKIQQVLRMNRIVCYPFQSSSHLAATPDWEVITNCVNLCKLLDLYTNLVDCAQ